MTKLDAENVVGVKRQTQIGIAEFDDDSVVLRFDAEQLPN